MNIEQIREYCLLKPGVTEDFPFDNETLVFKVGGKIFVLIGLERKPLFINLKADPDWSIELRENYHQIVPGYHMNKKHWNSVTIDGLKENFVKELLDHSYHLVFGSLTKKIQLEITTKE